MRIEPGPHPDKHYTHELSPVQERALERVGITPARLSDRELLENLDRLLELGRNNVILEMPPLDADIRNVLSTLADELRTKLKK